MVRIACNKCSYERSYKAADYDYILPDGSRLYVLLQRAWCGKCGQVTDAEFVPTVAEIERELLWLSRHSQQDLSSNEVEAVRQTRDHLSRRHQFGLLRQNPARCLECGSTEIAPWSPAEPLIHPGCGGAFRLVESTPEEEVEHIACDCEGRRIP